MVRFIPFHDSHLTISGGASDTFFYQLSHGIDRMMTAYPLVRFAIVLARTGRFKYR